jgi:acetyl-CoA carboxylase biotin carboxyl carrier protein
VPLTAQDVAEITRLLEESSFDELYLEHDGLKLTLKRGVAARHEPVEVAPVAAAAATPAPPAAAPGAGPERAAAVAQGESATTADALVQNVPAPLLGTFYRAPKPGAPPYVEVGSRVQEDTIIGIIEVMKLMNTVRAGAQGRVVEILARDGALVEYGEVLLRVAKGTEA